MTVHETNLSRFCKHHFFNPNIRPGVDKTLQEIGPLMTPAQLKSIPNDFLILAPSLNDEKNCLADVRLREKDNLPFLFISNEADSKLTFEERKERIGWSLALIVAGVTPCAYVMADFEGDELTAIQKLFPGVSRIVDADDHSRTRGNNDESFPTEQIEKVNTILRSWNMEPMKAPKTTAAERTAAGD
jgi:hypothetical protein